MFLGVVGGGGMVGISVRFGIVYKLEEVKFNELR